MLSEEGKSLSDLKPPLPDLHKDQFIQNCLMDSYVATKEDLSPEKAKLYFEANHKLNQDQKFVFDYIKGSIEGNNKEGKLIFGCLRWNGEIFTLNVIVSWIRMQGKEVATSATSRITATLLYLGRTVHIRFKVPFHLHKDSVCNVKKQSEVAIILSSIALGIIDEGPMLNTLCYEALDKTLKHLIPTEDK
jgi:hypothetical protein